MRKNRNQKENTLSNIMSLRLPKNGKFSTIKKSKILVDYKILKY